MEARINDYIISDDKKLLQLDIIKELLGETYWAKNRNKDVIEKSINNSICFGIYLKGKQVAFARCVTDYSVVYWLCDVIVAKAHRGKGLGKALVQTIIDHNDLKSLNSILSTNDAHGLYDKYGYTTDNEDKFIRRAT